MTIFLIVGLPGSGKSRRAKELESSESAIRITPDDWQMAIFDDDDANTWRSPARARHRDRIEGKLVELGLRVAQHGTDVVMDFGLWAKDERSALRSIAASLGLPCQVVYLPVELEDQRRRIRSRFTSEPGQFEMTDVDLVEFRTIFEPPDAAELAGTDLAPPPRGFSTWSHWASTRWPSLPDQY